MAYRYLQVETLKCDNCGKEAHKVTTEEKQSVGAELLDWEIFKYQLKKDGWIFPNDNNKEPTEELDVFCSIKCRDSKSG